MRKINGKDNPIFDIWIVHLADHFYADTLIIASSEFVLSGFRVRLGTSFSYKIFWFMALIVVIGASKHSFKVRIDLFEVEMWMFPPNLGIYSNFERLDGSGWFNRFGFNLSLQKLFIELHANFRFENIEDWFYKSLMAL